MMYIILIILVIAIICYLVPKFLQGGFSYKEEIISTKVYDVTHYGLYGEGYGVGQVTRVVIKRTYDDGTITFHTKEFKS